MQVRVKAEKIRKILAERNISQNMLAIYIGTTSGYLSQMVTGKRNPSPNMREKILKVLSGYQFNDIFEIKKVH